jgi:hypothetical protein
MSNQPHTNTHQRSNSLDASKALPKVKGWEWKKGMKIIDGWALGNEGERLKCENVRVDDVILRRPFSDKFMQSVRDPIPDMTDDETIRLCIETLRELWMQTDMNILPSGNGFAIVTRSGQIWSPTHAETMLTAFENIPWGDRDNKRWRTI